MEVRCWKPEQLGDTEWAQLDALWARDAARSDPMFAPAIARELGKVRPDTRILIAESGGEMTAFWALHLRPGGWARPIGGPFSDWHGAVRVPGSALRQIDLLRAVGISGMTAHALFPETSDPPAGGFRRQGAWIADLSDGVEALEAEQKRLFPNHVKRMRSKRARLAETAGEVEFRFDDPDPVAFDWLIDRKRRQFHETGLHDVLGPDWARAYVDRLRHLEGGPLRCQLSTLRAGGEVIAAEFNMASPTVMHGWITAYDLDHSKASPGLLLLQDVLRAMPAQGLRRYDCGPGAGHYKHYFANMSLPADRGVLACAASPSPMRLAGASWRRLEGALPEVVGGLMSKSRRRFDQILLSETRLGGRIGGVLGALRRLGA